MKITKSKATLGDKVCLREFLTKEKEISRVGEFSGSRLSGGISDHSRRSIVERARQLHVVPVDTNRQCTFQVQGTRPLMNQEESMSHLSIASLVPSQQLLGTYIFFFLGTLAACSTASTDAERPPLRLSQTKSQLIEETRLVVIEPIQAYSRCKGEAVLVSLPDEIACKENGSWVLTSSPTVLQPLSVLITSLRYAGLSTSDARSLTDAKQNGIGIGVLPLLTRSDARITGWSLSESSSGKLMKVIATVAARFVVIDLVTDKILWQGPLEQSVEDILPVPPLTENSVVLATGAGIGQFEPQMYAIRSLILQAYVQLGQSLARQIQDSALNGKAQ